MEKLSFLPVQGKTQLFPYCMLVSSLWASFISHTKHYTSDPSGHQRSGGPPNNSKSLTPAGVLQSNPILPLRTRSEH